jgi:hypothetical protein
MKSKTAVTLTAVPSSNSLNAAGEPAADSPAESSPMRRCRSDHSGGGLAPTAAATATRTRLPDRTPSTSKRNGAHAASPSPASRLSGSSPGPGRTPQTKRRELSLNQNIDKIATAAATPNGSPRSRDNSSSLSHSNNNRASQQPPPQQAGRTTRTGGSGAARTRTEQTEETSCRKSSNSSQDSGIGRELRSAVVGAAHRADRSSSRSSSAAAQHHNNTSGGGGSSRSRSSNSSNSSSQPPAILTLSPEEVEQEEGVSQTRARLEQLWGKDKMVELGIVRVPGTLLADIFHPGDIHTFYEVDAVPVAR